METNHHESLIDAPFPVQVYGLQQLAQMYFPYSTPSSASSQLKRWMRKTQLWVKLKEADYEDGQRLLTPRQVRIIVDHVGEPFCG